MTVESEKYDMKKVNGVYQRWANRYGIDVKVLRGDYFYPPEFWRQSIDDVLVYLMPTLKEYSLPNVIAKKEARYTCFPCVSKKLLLDTESRLADGIYSKIAEFMKEKSLNFERNKYYDALKKISEEKGAGNSEVSSLPLVTFFEPFFSYYLKFFIKKE